MIGSVAWFCFCLALGIGSVKLVAVAVVARRRRRYRRCLARIERLEVELGYRKGPATYAGLLRDLVGPGQMVEFVDRGLPRIYAPAGALKYDRSLHAGLDIAGRPTPKRQWTDDEMEQRHIDQGGKPMVWGY